MKRNRLSGWRVVAAVAVCILAAGAGAQPSSGPAAPERTAAVKPAFGVGETLYYEFGWNGISAATAKVWVEQGQVEGQEVYTFCATARTTSFVDRLYELRASGWSMTSVDTLLPLQNRLSQTENGRKTVQTVLFDRERKTAACRREREKDNGKPPSVRSAAIECESPCDPFAIAYLLRSQSLAVGDVKKAAIVAGSHLYELSVEVAGREKLKVEAGSFDALRLVPKFREVGKEADTTKVRKATLWVSDDARHLPLKLTSEVFVGSVYGELTRVETPPPGAPASASPSSKWPRRLIAARQAAMRGVLAIPPPSCAEPCEGLYEPSQGFFVRSQRR